MPRRPSGFVKKSIGFACLGMACAAWIGLFRFQQFGLAVLLALLAIVLGHFDRRNLRWNSKSQFSEIMAFIGLFFAYTFVVLAGTGIFSPETFRESEVTKRSKCAINLKQMWIVFKMFGNESPGNLWPELSPEAGKFMFRPDETESLPSLQEDYLTDANIIVCPSHSEVRSLRKQGDSDPVSLIDDHSYFYLGYAITNDTDLEAFAAAYRQRIAEGLPFDADLPIPGDSEHRVIYRLKQGVERLFITDINNPAGSALARSTIPVMWDRLDIDKGKPRSSHTPMGGNVLFMDGHVNFIKYPGKFPMTETAVRIMAELDAM